MTLPLVERALCTAAFLHHHRTTTDPRHPDRAEQHLRARLRLAALLGLPYQQVTAPYPPVETNGRRPLTLTATDPADPQVRLWFYLPDSATADDTFYAMGPCPACNTPVPLLPVAVLADLAPLLATSARPRRMPPAPGDPVFTTHPAHPRTCPYRALPGRATRTR